MNKLSRTLSLAALVAAVIAPAAHAQSERLTLTVAAPVHIAQQKLAPGVYEIAASPIRGVFTIENKQTEHRIFVHWSSASIWNSDNPQVDVVRESDGQLAITQVFFPQTGMSYRFQFGDAKKEATVRAALRQ